MRSNLSMLAAFILMAAFHSLSVSAQTHKTENLVIITIDGLRWQEVFRGADEALIDDEKFVKKGVDELKKEFLGPTEEERRKKLMPFMWSYIVQNGQIYGNRDLKNYVNMKNSFLLSYPGYNEIFTGYPDPQIDSNSHGPNENVNVLEYINKQEGFKNKIAAFSLWYKISDILNPERSGFPVSAGRVTVKENINGMPLTDKQKEINEKIEKAKGENRINSLTYGAAKEYLNVNKPRVFYISLSGTDGEGHAKRYDGYLRAANEDDGYIRDMWEYLQNHEQYKDKTTLFIAVDHGRGRGEYWYSHGLGPYLGSDETWFAVLGPDTPAKGEIKSEGQLYQNQFAQTLAAFLGMKFESPNPSGEPIKDLMLHALQSQ